MGDDLRQQYEPFDQEKWLGRSPWSPNDPRLQAWESAHGHDVRLKCYPEFGCQVIEASLERRVEVAERTLAKIREWAVPPVGKAPSYEGYIDESDPNTMRGFNMARRHVRHILADTGDTDG